MLSQEVHRKGGSYNNNTLKRAPGRKGGGGQKKGLEVASADFTADKIENKNGLISLKKEEDTRSNSFDET